MKTHKLKFTRLALMVVLALVLSACGAGSKEPTPTPVDVNAVAANAIATFAMGLTQTALAQPTATITPSPSATNTLAPVVLSGTNTPAAQPTSSCDLLIFVTDVTVSDGTVMAPGQVFDKTWRIQNGGTCTWTPTYKAVFTGSGNGSLGGATTPIGKTIKPNEYVDVTVQFTAPSAAGDYISWWKLQNDSGVWLSGTTFSVVIKVVGNTQTAAPPTETPTATP